MMGKDDDSISAGEPTIYPYRKLTKFAIVIVIDISLLSIL